MTPAEFRDWRRRMDLTRPALLEMLRGLGWTDLSLRALDTWQRRGPPQCAAVLLGLLESPERLNRVMPSSRRSL